MQGALKLSKYSLGVGDRFAHQAKAQLAAFIQAGRHGVELAPVWNKSYREHTIIGSRPSSTREAADAAVKALGWDKPYHVDADHINLHTVEAFLDACDFYTLDVADAIGKPADKDYIDAFVGKHPELAGPLEIEDLPAPLSLSPALVERAAMKYCYAVQEAGRIYREIELKKGPGQFIAEVSMDETDYPQTPPELLVILAGLADEGVALQTIAPKFSGRFNKGVDYVGHVDRFEREFESDIAVIRHAVHAYALPANLKLSVHSGSDKFSLYPAIRRALRKFDAGVHLKTAGTNWLEELIGLAEAGGDGLAIAKEIYSEAYAHQEELKAPYATVIDIDAARLPAPELVNQWTSEQFTSALRHNQACPEFNPHLRQLLHVAFKVAARMGRRYLSMLESCEATISRNVTENLFERHIKPLLIVH